MKFISSYNMRATMQDVFLPFRQQCQKTLWANCAGKMYFKVNESTNEEKKFN
ncbi:hypothetical protein Scep_012804 [Stephania cephalantha]|uniref:Uncharacterized protein n=1 Tax=Stephania cephalantha TaxID=152367 RepID=A0AAP0JH23_9MAGN